MAQEAEIPISLATLSNVELIHLWRIEGAEAARNLIISEGDEATHNRIISEFKKTGEARNRIISEVKKRKLFPDDEGSVSDGGLYPDVEDPNFVSRLLKKSEFADTYSPPLSAEEGSCISGGDFEVTPVQRFVANFLHPRTPYMSALLYHGVGVGKTCAAIQTAEAYLDVYPRRKVMIVAPPTIQAGFYRTIFDVENLRIGVGEVLNSAVGCTGDTYLRITGLINERNKDIIEKDVRKAIKSRYEFYGYLQFRNYIRSITNKVSRKGNKDEIRLREIDALKKEFNYRLLIIDEAHNLRDVSSTGVVEEEEETDTVGTEDEKEEAKAGKLLTPFLNNLLDSTDGMKLLLMTATPMFNSVLEIVHIFNLLLRNDKKATIIQSQIMDPQGNLIEGAEAIIKPLANAYISFMRGENPNSFPLRLFPEGMDPRGRPIDRITKENYPKYIFSTRNDLIEVDPENPEDPESKHRQSKRVEKLPLVKSESLEGSHSFKVMTALTKAGSRMGSNYMIIDSLLQAGNCVFPVGEDTPDSFVGLKGFQNNFIRRGKGIISAKDASWLSEENIHKYSPKMATILQFVKKSEGVDFIYSRFVTAGALLMSLILEANGYTMYGRNNLLEQGIQSMGGRQCALCSEREAEHTGTHEFRPAMYVLLTGDKDLSPNNKASIDAARSDKNVDGGVVKVVIGSQIAGEGLDLRFIREVHILDAWFHLNKTEQIIGRGIRFRSHCLIEDVRKRNTTVFLHVLTIQGYENETADLYCYRSALLKAILSGQVSRALKIFAVDCNLRKDVTVLSGLGNRIQVDSQGDTRKGIKGDGILIDDMPYTAMCDWMECTYTCDPVVPIDVDSSNNSTYDAFSARYRETKIQKVIQGLFAKQAYWAQDDLKQALIDTGSPLIAINLTLQGILNNRLFRVTHGSREGYIIYKNRYFLFQPEVYKNNSIPLAIRAMDFPIRRDEYTPAVKNKPVVEVVEDKGKESVSKDLWTQLLTWVNGVISGKVTVISKEIERHIELYTAKLSQESKVYTDKLGMIVFLSKRIEDKETYKKVILEYLWDEWLDSATQLSYYSSKDPVIESIANENIVSSGGYEAFRYIDSQSNILKYICQDGGPCPKGVVDAFSKMDEDIKKTQAVEEKTGKMYGFVVPKTGNMVFKTTNPHKEGSAVKGGQECGIVASGEYINKLTSISKVVSDKGVPIKDFNEVNFLKKTVKTDNKRTIEISNNIQGCTLLDLTLRFMDKLKVDNKRWFFRPLEAYYSGHFGRTTAEAKKAVKAEKKALKKVEAEAKKQEKVDKKKPVTVAVAAKPVPKLIFTSKAKPPPAPAMPTVAEALGDEVEEPIVNTIKKINSTKHKFVRMQKAPAPPAPPPPPSPAPPPPPSPAPPASAPPPPPSPAPAPAPPAPAPPPPPSSAPPPPPSPAPAPPAPAPPAPAPPAPAPAPDLTNLAAPPPPGLDVPPPGSPALAPPVIKKKVENMTYNELTKAGQTKLENKFLSPAVRAMKARAEAARANLAAAKGAK